MIITRQDFGGFSSGRAELFELSGPRGMKVRVLSFGAMLAGVDMPDRHGNITDVVLGFDTLDGYLADPIKVGALCGRVVNRIRKGRFSIRERVYQLACNDGPNHIHGGPQGFDRHIWDVEVDEPANAVTFLRISPDGEEGYPGNLQTRVRYQLTPDGELALSMEATTDATTIVNLSTHAYWNLAGHASGSVLGHRLMVDAERYTPLDAELLPTGALEPVAGTPFDFRQPKPIGAGMPAGGYDINFWLNQRGGEPHLAALVEDEASGRVLELRTNQPGLQIYSGGLLSPAMIGKGGIAYRSFGGIALEPQKFADAPNHPSFPSIKLEPGETYRHESIFRFFTR